MKILFLSNNEISDNLIYWLRNTAKEEIVVYDKPVNIEFLKKIKTNFIISYTYKFIIKQEIINYMKNNIINLHISLLPWNRGISPNIWSFLENTPKGVSIHIIDKGIDSGPILLQKEFFFNENTETLRSTYIKLQQGIQELFRENWEEIKNGSLKKIPQRGKGTIHYKKNFKLIESLILDTGWDIAITELKKRYLNMSKYK